MTYAAAPMSYAAPIGQVTYAQAPMEYVAAPQVTYAQAAPMVTQSASYVAAPAINYASSAAQVGYQPQVVIGQAVAQVAAPEPPTDLTVNTTRNLSCCLEAWDRLVGIAADNL